MEIPQLADRITGYQADTEWQSWHTNRERARKESIARQAPVLRSFLEGRIKADELRRWMEQESRQYNLWGFGGMNGQMFLNMLCNNSTSPDHLSSELRKAIFAPQSKSEAVARIHQFVQFVREENGRVTPANKRAAPGFAPFFLSYFWFVQGGPILPIYYPSAVNALETLDVVDLNDIEDPALRYEAYSDWMEKVRDDLRSLTNESASFTDAEGLMYWIAEKAEGTVQSRVSTGGVPPSDPGNSAEDAEPETEQEATEHTEIQWMLAQIGKLRGFKVHIATGDVNKTWKGHRLGDVGGDELPSPGYTPQDRKSIEYIDVIWFRGNDITHLFEVESTTRVWSGLLRMSDLLTLQPHLRPSLNIVAPKSREGLARRMMERPTFREMRDGAGGRKFEFKSFDSVRAQYAAEMEGSIIH